MTSPSAPSATHELDLRDYLRPLVLRWWLILGLLVAVTVATYVYYERQAPSYTTATRIFISAGTDNQAVTGFVQPPTDRTTLNQATLLTTGAVAAQVAKSIGIPVERVNGVSATASEGSDFITVQAVNHDPVLAAKLANGFAAAFVDLRSDERRARLQKALDEQRDQLEAVRPTRENASLRTDYQQAIAQLEAAISTPSGEARQLDPAGVPGVPTSPNPERNALFAAILALIAGVGLAFGLERFDRRLKRVEDVEETYGVPLMVVLPHSRSVAGFVDGNAALDDDFREAFRQLRTNLQLESLTTPIKRILVTSAVPGEGKSTVARNLAIAYREFGVRVAVIDADLRRPTMGELFGTETRIGLTTVMAGEETLPGAIVDIPVHAKGLATLAKIQEVTAGSPGPVDAGTTQDIAKLSLLTAGPAPPNPQAVLSTARMSDIIESVAADHDVLIIDSPPVTVVSDALALAGQVDAIVVVARLEVTPKEAARRAVTQLNRVPGVNVVGVVANDITGSEASKYSYGYQSLDFKT